MARKYSVLYNALFLVCVSFYFCPVALDSVDYDVRLTGTDVPWAGRVEVFLDGSWGTICYDGRWGSNEAEAVCRQLGYPHGSATVDLPYYGASTEPVHATSVVCPPDSDGLGSCDFTRGTTCDTELSSLVHCNVNVRLIGSTESRGIVQVYAGAWKTLCVQDWPESNNEVACRSVGFHRTLSSQFRLGHWDQNYPADLVCSGEEDNLSDCLQNNFFLLGECVAVYLTCGSKADEATSSNTDVNQSRFILSTALGGVCLVLVFAVALFIRIARKMPRRGASSRAQPEQPRRSNRFPRQPRRSRTPGGRQASDIFSISGGSEFQGDAPPYERLEDDDGPPPPPPYSQILQPQIEIPIVGREERYEDGRAPRCIQTEALEFFRETESQEQPEIEPTSPTDLGRGKTEDVAGCEHGQDTEAPVLHHDDIPEGAGQIAEFLRNPEQQIPCAAGPSSLRSKNVININATTYSVEI
ncbi:uncharacterized protein [Diadema antillarum]|uniref:uncharacterized protein n=1 Tax=Diadema antillarum TaxID=105358 RepID=UPI003A877AF1